MSGTWFESTGMKQYSFLTFFWLPALFPQTALSFTSFWRAPFFSPHPQVKGTFVPNCQSDSLGADRL